MRFGYYLEKTKQKKNTFEDASRRGPPFLILSISQSIAQDWLTHAKCVKLIEVLLRAQCPDAACMHLHGWLTFSTNLLPVSHAKEIICNRSSHARRM